MVCQGEMGLAGIRLHRKRLTRRMGAEFEPGGGGVHVLHVEEIVEARQQAPGPHEFWVARPASSSMVTDSRATLPSLLAFWVAKSDFARRYRS